MLRWIVVLLATAIFHVGAIRGYLNDKDADGTTGKTATQITRMLTNTTTNHNNDDNNSDNKPLLLLCHQSASVSIILTPALWYPFLIIFICLEESLARCWGSCCNGINYHLKIDGIAALRRSGQHHRRCQKTVGCCLLMSCATTNHRVCTG